LYCGDRLEEFHEDNDGKFVKGITTLTRLTSLELDICLPATSLQGIAGLPMLEKLGLRVGDIANNASFYVKLPHKPGSRRPGEIFATFFPLSFLPFDGTPTWPSHACASHQKRLC